MHAVPIRNCGDLPAVRRHKVAQACRCCAAKSISLGTPAALVRQSSSRTPPSPLT